MDKVKMTHNEYQEFLRKNAARLYDEKGYTMAHFQQDADSVAVIGFDLDRFGLTFSEKGIAAINGCFREEGTNRHGNLSLSGHAMSDNVVYQLRDVLGLDYGCHNCYNGFYYSAENRCVLEFCEGDLYLILCEDDEKFKEEFESFCEFYGVEKDDRELGSVLENAAVRSDATAAKDAEDPAVEQTLGG